MGRIISHMHLSIDGFCAGLNGEMDWIKVDEEMFDFVKTFTDNSDTALYGRVTWQMMDDYWPNAGSKPNASKHDKEHSEWYNKVDKYVLSNTISNKGDALTTFIHGDIEKDITAIKLKAQKDIMLFGSPSAVKSLMKHNLIDEYWIFINPVILGKGSTMFATLDKRIDLQLKQNIKFPCGVIALQFSV